MGFFLAVRFFAAAFLGDIYTLGRGKKLLPAFVVSAGGVPCLLLSLLMEDALSDSAEPLSDPEICLDSLDITEVLPNDSVIDGTVRLTFFCIASHPLFCFGFVCALFAS